MPLDPREAVVQIVNAVGMLLHTIVEDVLEVVLELLSHDVEVTHHFLGLVLDVFEEQFKLSVMLGEFFIDLLKLAIVLVEFFVNSYELVIVPIETLRETADVRFGRRCSVISGSHVGRGYRKQK
ncbi:MAG: hypothetical protein R3B91_16125 [Planctomycetaceae bacterium]